METHTWWLTYFSRDETDFQFPHTRSDLLSSSQFEPHKAETCHSANWYALPPPSGRRLLVQREPWISQHLSWYWVCYLSSSEKLIRFTDDPRGELWNSTKKSLFLIKRHTLSLTMSNTFKNSKGQGSEEKKNDIIRPSDDDSLWVKMTAIANCRRLSMAVWEYSQWNDRMK